MPDEIVPAVETPTETPPETPPEPVVEFGYDDLLDPDKPLPPEIEGQVTSWGESVPKGIPAAWLKSDEGRFTAAALVRAARGRDADLRTRAADLDRRRAELDGREVKLKEGMRRDLELARDVGKLDPKQPDFHKQLNDTFRAVGKRAEEDMERHIRTEWEATKPQVIAQSTEVREGFRAEMTRLGVPEEKIREAETRAREGALAAAKSIPLKDRTVEAMVVPLRDQLDLAAARLRREQASVATAVDAARADTRGRLGPPGAATTPRTPASTFTEPEPKDPRSPEWAAWSDRRIAHVAAEDARKRSRGSAVAR